MKENKKYLDLPVEFGLPTMPEGPGEFAYPEAVHIDSPFRLSIYAYSTDDHLDLSTLSQEHLRLFLLLRHIERAKSMKKPIGFLGFFEMIRVLSLVPDNPEHFNSEDLIARIIQFLKRATDIYGIGITMAICMLSGVNGKYPTRDQKVGDGMARLGILTAAENAAFQGKDPKAFTEVYVEKVFPVWHQLLKTMAPHQIDSYFGRHANPAMPVDMGAMRES